MKRVREELKLEAYSLPQSSTEPSENVINLTNTAIDREYGERIVRLNTTSLFNSDNCEGIKRIISLIAESLIAAGDHRGLEYKALVEEGVFDYSSLQLNDPSEWEAILNSKKDILLMLKGFQIEFSLKKGESCIPSIFQHLIENPYIVENSQYILVKDPDDEVVINLEDVEFLKSYKLEKL